ncbi:MAG: acyl-CoA dehydrogenase family protein [Acidimicrobiales bacterium]
MDLELGVDERALQDGLRSFLDGRFPMAAVRAQADGLDRALWRELADTGVFGLRLPEADGGVGLGMTEAVLVFEELGRSLVAGPVLGTHLAAALVPGAASGDTVVGLIERPADVVLVEHLAVLDVLLAIDDDGIWTIDPARLTAEPVARPLDPLTPLHRVVDLPQGERLAGAGEASTWRRQGATLVAAMLLGMAARSTELAVAYAGEREQFGKPIGAFQAVKHLCADMLTRAEVARGVVYAAGVTLDGRGVDDVDRLVAAAKITAGDAAKGNAKACIQVHGGMGFTWEIDAHLFLKRAIVLDTVFGSVDDHCEAVAVTL